MCGIFGYIGKNLNAPEIVIDGLKKLEYRGYDSWGIAFPDNAGKIMVQKQVGKISDHKGSIAGQSNLAIGHSRWATHGGVTDANAHPHFSEKKDVVVVHNGIIENFSELRAELKAEGHIFTSETDTEVVPHLIEKYKSFGLEIAFRKALMRLEGRFAVVCIFEGEQTLYAARRGSPLIVGLGKEEIFLASDIPAFLAQTRDINYIDDGEMLIASMNDLVFKDFETGNIVNKRTITIDLKEDAADKGDYEHFMLKEIMEQKQTIAQATNQDERQIIKVAEAIRNAKGTFLVGCGTAGKVCLAAQYFFAQVSGIHVNTVAASEFPVYHRFLNDKSLLIVVSQSGETADVLEAMNVAKKKGVQIIALVNAKGSSIERAADYTLNINAGPEKAVASTKAATSQLALLLLIAYAVSWKLIEGIQVLIRASSKVSDMLNPRYLDWIRNLAKKIAKQENAYIIGKAANFPMALESAIKIQEVSYIHAEGFAGGELKHGPIALIHDQVPCIVLYSNDETKKDIISNAIELKARGGFMIGVGPKDGNDIFDYWISVPDAETAGPIVNIIPIQILSYFLAVERGLNPDMPRNLAKSVTVK